MGDETPNPGDRLEADILALLNDEFSYWADLADVRYQAPDFARRLRQLAEFHLLDKRAAPTSDPCDARRRAKPETPS